MDDTPTVDGDAEANDIPVVDRNVEIVAFDNQVNLYEPGDDSAEMVHAVASLAGADVVRVTVTPEQWQKILEHIQPEWIRDWRQSA